LEGGAIVESYGILEEFGIRWMGGFELQHVKSIHQLDSL